MTGELTLAGLYGSLRLQPNGVYTYSVDNTLSVVNSLSEDESLDDLFTLLLVMVREALSLNRWSSPLTVTTGQSQWCDR